MKCDSRWKGVNHLKWRHFLTSVWIDSKPIVLDSSVVLTDNSDWLVLWLTGKLRWIREPTQIYLLRWINNHKYLSWGKAQTWIHYFVLTQVNLFHSTWVSPSSFVCCSTYKSWIFHCYHTSYNQFGCSLYFSQQFTMLLLNLIFLMLALLRRASLFRLQGNLQLIK